jgi:hypothetical protein
MSDPMTGAVVLAAGKSVRREPKWVCPGDTTVIAGGCYAGGGLEKRSGDRWWREVEQALGHRGLAGAQFNPGSLQEMLSSIRDGCHCSWEVL